MVPIPDNITSAQTEVHTTIIARKMNDTHMYIQAYSKVQTIMIAEKLFIVIKTVFSLKTFHFYWKCYDALWYNV